MNPVFLELQALKSDDKNKLNPDYHLAKLISKII